MNVRPCLTIAVLCVTALSGCASVTSDINFQPPGAGWSGSPSILGRAQFWIKTAQGGNTSKSIVLLIRGVSSTKEVFSNPGLGTNGRVEEFKQEHTTICGSQPADHIVATGKYSSTGGSGSAQTEGAFEAFMTAVHGENYVAVYIRPRDLAPDPQAEAAIRSLCAKPV